jgi:hypothetical protein
LITCTSKEQKQKASVSLSTDSNFALSPVQTALSIIGGIPFIPVFAKKSIKTINEFMKQGKVKLTLEFTYENAYEKKWKDVNDEGDTGQVFKNMLEASMYFHKLLMKIDIKNAENYYLTSIDNDKNATLLAVVYRKNKIANVNGKYNPESILSFNSKEPNFYEPYQFDSDNKPLDTIIDFGGVEKTSLSTQKLQSILLTMATNSVLQKKKSPEYWEIEKRWLAGEVEEIMQDQNASVHKKLEAE